MENENAESKNTAGPEVAVADAFNPTRFNHIYVNMAFTLNLGDQRLLDTKSSLSAVAIHGNDYNLYSPFRKSGAAKGAEGEAACPGIVRAVLGKALEVTDSVNNSHIVFVGDTEAIGSTIVSAIETTRRSIEAMLPEKPGHVLFDIADDSGEGEPVILDSLRFSDVVSVRSWINSPKEPDSQVVSNNAVLNFVVGAGALYDSADKLKYVTQVETVLNLLVKNNSGAVPSTNIVLALALPAMLLSDFTIRDLIGELMDDHQFVLYSRMELENLEADDSGFLPQCVSDVGQLIPSQCDLLLMKLLGGDSDPEGV